ncbi:glycerophosphodiester phosphodiesterase [Sulfitobacter pseudonitzschiae]|uniref:glycerophosphodiester phosphodiesterase n=1 Tax=Pseudosulfitobacter pseudonitzschiae TaxID=1402135 RepID=A0A9Q2NN88_9RHOB|nr:MULTISPECIES: glycerophosphodiester phosphodiesterase family protein [Roseobacteraceae]MBM2291118.1 glycerophosphodiester phosphodiesterase [Pseudosulfitobacter pseudonitzschiae]MBM2296036.1 glycerophosphodiester phosphodiesterase [Pseudosulfitobacter pseudonitzschiae]MBM2300949.1 glycerophosphodiester phosphodiesterase [Pseudosulfitobacter pseudonitzschiae]MBM2310733.1 glycerophosphodiester phosphodiesterase [Pseudosulfitobacter pseudonitzschiae]MBM2315646.1 glycerophosphodiester phosphodi|tara:strand:- start:2717 stop:3928 length:1212 start_codon:yes stop_codon:yes gene_type:complete
MRITLIAATLAALPAVAFADGHGQSTAVSYGARPAYLVDKLPEGPLKEKLASCMGQTPAPTAFSIGHRGAALQFPEHTDQSYIAGARQGAGILECDVTFTKDHELVCRHAQNDLHTTTNILVSDLADTCNTAFTPASGDTKASAECRTSELTLEQFRTLTPKMDSFDATATTAEAFQGGVAGFRTTLYTDKAKLMTHAESIELIKSLGAKFTPELKSPSVEMPHDGFSQEDYAQKMIDEYKAAGIPASDVWAQSFNLDDVLYWVNNEPEFGKQAVYLVEWSDGFDEQDKATWNEDFAALKEQGVQYLAPSLNMLLTDDNGAIAASAYALAAKEAGLKLIAWTLERSGPLASGGGWYFQSVGDVVKDDSDYLVALDVIAQDIGVEGVFSDWPATVTYYANCMGL